MTTHHHNGRKRGFTLIELLVAMTITAIIVAVLVSITGTAIDTWNRSREELRASRQAEAMIQIMSKDLESLVMRSGNQQEWLSAISSIPADGGSSNAARLVFFTAATDRYEGQVGVQGVDQGGDISCVGYQLSWKDPVSIGTPTEEFETFVLSRHIVDPDETFENLLGRTDDTYTLDRLFMSGRDGSDGGNPFGGYSAEIGQDRNFVCENIFQFTLVFHLETYDAGGAAESQLVSIGTTGGGKTEFRVRDNEIVTVAADTDLADAVLTAVEVAVTVLTDRAITQLRGNENLADDAEWLAANSYHFSRLIQVPRK